MAEPNELPKKFFPSARFVYGARRRHNQVERDHDYSEYGETSTKRMRMSSPRLPQPTAQPPQQPSGSPSRLVTLADESFQLQQCPDSPFVVDERPNDPFWGYDIVDARHLIIQVLSASETHKLNCPSIGFLEPISKTVANMNARIKMKCRNCSYTTIVACNKPGTNVGEQFAWATSSAGSSYSQLEKQLSLASIKPMDFKTYAKFNRRMKESAADEEEQDDVRANEDDETELAVKGILKN